ncbi:MAG: LytR C-terminal domain-containing protein [Ignavibacteriaceae bacterium]|nr:LytR C-terminal domain-containing protein [Ignavibacteriaceae bacterium]
MTGIFILSGISAYLIFLLFSSFYAEQTEKKIVLKPTFKSTLQVEVLNGCGVKGITEEVTKFLRSKNIDVVKTGNYSNFNVEKTLIVERKGNSENAKIVAQMLGANDSNILESFNQNLYLDLTIIVGRDYKNLKILNEVNN